ncbi:hypothetical protein HK102_001430, partial [Quaeritorhiza haematococci]
MTNTPELSPTFKLRLTPISSTKSNFSKPVSDFRSSDAGRGDDRQVNYFKSAE